MLLKNATYLTKDMKFTKGNIFIDDETLKIMDNDFKLDDTNSINCDDFIILPGLFNSHYHTPSNCFRGIFKDMTKNDWCKDNYIGKIHTKFFDALNEKLPLADYKVLCIKSYVELIKKGVTFIGDSPVSNRSSHILADIVRNLGIKSCINAGDDYENLRFKNDTQVKFFAHLPEEATIDDGSLYEATKLKSSLNPPLSIHCLESLDCKNSILDKYNCSTIKLFNKNNLLDNKTVLFHCVHIDNDDIEILKESKTSIISCPITTLKSGSGVVDMKACLKNNINIALGTDWAFTDIWDVMRAAYLHLKVNSSMDEFSAESVLRMVTLNGAKSLGVENETGTIDNGYKADLIFLNKNDSRLYPIINNENFSNLAQNILMEGNEDMVVHVMCNGKWIVRDRKFLLIDEEELDFKYENILNSIVS